MISTENISVNSSLPKKILPGNAVVKINNIKLTQPPFAQKDNGYKVTMEVETKPIDGFEGFAIDANDPNKGYHLGQIGWVDTAEFYYSDGVTKTGIQKSRDKGILTDLLRIMNAIGCDDWRKQNEGKHETIEDYVAAFDHDAPFKDKWVNMCIAGRKYINQKGYEAFQLFLPRDTRGKFAITPESDIAKCIVFNEVEHIKYAPSAKPGATVTQQDVEVFNNDEKPLVDEDLPFGNDDDSPWTN